MRTLGTMLTLIGICFLAACGGSSSGGGGGEVARDAALVGTWRSASWYVSPSMNHAIRIELGADGDYELMTDRIVARIAPLVEYPGQEECWETGTWHTEDGVLHLTPVVTGNSCNDSPVELTYADAGTDADGFPIMDVDVPIDEPPVELRFTKHLLYDPDPASVTQGERRWYNWTGGEGEPWSLWFYNNGTFHGGTQGCDVEGIFTDLGNQLQLAITAVDPGVECNEMALFIGGFHDFEYLYQRQTNGQFEITWEDDGGVSTFNASAPPL